MKVILDTNFLIYCAAQKIDYAEQIRDLVKGKYELVVLGSVLSELDNLKRRAKKYNDRAAAKLALELLRVNDVRVEEIGERKADEAIVAMSGGNIVATVDLELRKRVEKAIVIRGRKKLEID